MIFGKLPPNPPANASAPLPPRPAASAARPAVPGADPCSASANTIPPISAPGFGLSPMAFKEAARAAYPTAAPAPPTRCKA